MLPGEQLPARRYSVFAVLVSLAGLNNFRKSSLRVVLTTRRPGYVAGSSFAPPSDAAHAIVAPHTTRRVATDGSTGAKTG